LLQALTPKEAAPHDKTISDIIEDTSYLAEQLQIIKAACEAYDDDAAYAALDRLDEKSWNQKTADTLDQIRDALFLSSDFAGVVLTLEHIGSSA
jgi:hypothetical protein